MSTVTTPKLSETIKALIESHLLEIHTALPAKILSYDYGKNLAVVQPLLKRKYRTETSSILLPTISNVPVAFPRMGNAWVRLPVNPGDEGKISFCERSIDKWLENGGAVDPDDPRKFSLSDAVFEPGLNSLKNLMVSPGAQDSLEINYNGSYFEILSNGKLKISNGTNELFEILVQLVTDLQTATDAAGFPFNADTIAKFAALQVKLETLKG